MEKDVAIRIENLSKTFLIHEDQKMTLRALFASFFKQGRTKKYKALDNINLEIYRGEFFGIIGSNGSGKSTLLKLIAGIYNPDKGGSINYQGRLVPFLELGVGFNPDLTGRENIFLNGTILGMSLKYLRSKVDEIVEFAELKEFIDMPVKNYSSGMMVRLAFAIAMHSNANIFLMDEVLSVGDAAFQKKSAKVIKEFKSQGRTMVYVTHSMNNLIDYCDRAAVIDKSRLIFVGEPKEAVEVYDKSISY
jgi:ABC-type polysaccharide/polyol phosphate transport system ATPase subunit